MTNIPSKSPIDPRPHVIYDAHQRVSTEKSYENYKKLCEIMGKGSISFEEYAYWFKEYSKKTGRELPDIRGCILSDVINGKSAEKSIDDLSEAFKNHKIDKEDHDYWFKRFENGHLFNQASFSNLPEEMIAKIVEKSDLMSYLQLRKVSNGLRRIVDYSKPPLTLIAARFGQNSIIFHLNDDLSLFFTHRKRENPPPYYSDYFFKFVGNDYTKMAFKYLEMFLKHPKLQLITFHVATYNYKPDKNNQMIRDLLNSLSHKIHSQSTSCSVLQDEDIITVLKCLKPGTLKELRVYGSEQGKLSNSGELVEMEQWKNAKFLRCDQLLDTSIEHFFHFNEFYINIVSMSIEDVLNLSHALSDSPDFKNCVVKVKRYDQGAAKNALRLNQNLDIQLSTSEIRIEKKQY